MLLQLVIPSLGLSKKIIRNLNNHFCKWMIIAPFFINSKVSLTVEP